MINKIKMGFGLLTLILISIAICGKPSFAEAPTISKEQVYENELHSWIQRLAKDESGDSPIAPHIDSNGKYSYSCLQFQYDTFVSMASKYKIPGEIMTCSAQKALAEAMIRDDWNNWHHWQNSVLHKTAGYPPVVQ